jgi:hypothetical protein
MIDLHSRNQNVLTPEDITLLNLLVDKYLVALNELNNEQKSIAGYIAYVIEQGVLYVKEKNIPADWKCWTIVYLKELLLLNKIKDESDIPTLIEKFLTHYSTHYPKYLDSVGVSSSDYDRDRVFVYQSI